MKHFILALLSLYVLSSHAQAFYYGADLSYTNEMEDCGAVFKQNNQAVDPYQLFIESGCNLVRIRLWHTPSWYKSLNKGKMYSDINDVIKSIQRAKAANSKVLLDFHLSDTWADPSRQLIPKAWESIAGNLPVLQDSLSNYIAKTLLILQKYNSLPDIIQIGNETNKGIMLTPEQDKQYTLEWPRNAALFNTALKAITNFENNHQVSIKTAIHIANPKDASWLAKAFYDNGVREFDIIGLSYYWAWHKPLTITETGQIIASLKAQYKKDIMIFETGYIWTNGSNDSASNIISEVHPDYAPASPDAQYRWLHDLTAEVKKRGGIGVCYWEPSWVSTVCNTQWGKGSHQEHATFFDFKNNALNEGGFRWLNENKINATTEVEDESIVIFDPHSRVIMLTCCHDSLLIDLYNVEGKYVNQYIIWRDEPFALDTGLHGIFVIRFDQNKKNKPIKPITISL